MFPVHGSLVVRFMRSKPMAQLTPLVPATTLPIQSKPW